MRLAANTACKKSPSRYHRATLSGHIFATKACIDNRKKNMLNNNTSSTFRHNRPMDNFGPVTAENRWRVLGHPSKFIRVSRLGSVTARYSSRGRHLYLAGRPSRLALAHISSLECLTSIYSITQQTFTCVLKKILNFKDLTVISSHRNFPSVRFFIVRAV